MSNCFFSTSRDGDSSITLNNLFQCLTTFAKKILLNVQLESALLQNEAMPSCPFSGCTGEEANHHLATTSFWKL